MGKTIERCPNCRGIHPAGYPDGMLCPTCQGFVVPPLSTHIRTRPGSALPPNHAGTGISVDVDRSRSMVLGPDRARVELTVKYGADCIADISVVRRRWNDALADALDIVVRRLRED